MDLSPIIFVVLVLAWAVYLIPKALSHHDEVAAESLVEGHTEDVRVLSRTRRVASAAAATVSRTSAPAAAATHDAAPAEPVEVTVTASEVVEESVEVATSTTTGTTAVTDRPVPVPARAARPATAAAVQTSRPLPTRASARRAARNRRRVLAVLLVALVAVVGGVVAGSLPAWVVAVPAGLVVGFLVLARSAVRRMQQLQAGPAPAHRTAAPSASSSAPAAASAAAPGAPVRAASSADTAVEDALAELAADPSEERRVEVETALSENGSLWDPLPLTLPTYVGKAQARRTVRTIELTGITSSGHDAADSAVAREAADQAAQDASAETMATSKVVGG